MAKIFRTATRWLRSDNPKSKIQNPKWVGVLAIFVLLLGCVGVVEAQLQCENADRGHEFYFTAPRRKNLTPSNAIVSGDCARSRQIDAAAERPPRVNPKLSMVSQPS